jgi:hypothetical protein
MLLSNEALPDGWLTKYPVSRVLSPKMVNSSKPEAETAAGASKIAKKNSIANGVNPGALGMAKVLIKIKRSKKMRR